MLNNRLPAHSFAYIAIAGEALIDLIRQEKGHYNPCLGGSVFNLTRALARQGVGVTYLNPLSSDTFGKALRQALQDDGVQLAQQQACTAPTSLALVSLNDEGKADYAFYRQGVADRAVSAAQLNAACAALPHLEIVCTGCLALSPDDAHIYLPWLAQQKAQHKLIVVDANLRLSVMPDVVAYRSNIHAALAYADIIKVSDDDLTALNIAGENAVEQAQTLLKSTRAQLLALTLGAEGAMLLHASGKQWRARENTALTVVDTVGAGDCFLAGLLVALLNASCTPTLSNHADEAQHGLGHTLQNLEGEGAYHLLQHALASASLCVMQEGCMPPSLSEVQTFRAQHSLQIE